MKAITAKTFNRFLSDTFRSLKTLRDRVQMLIAFGAESYASDGNTIYLTKILRHATETHGLNARGIQAYCQAVANVRWTTDAVGDKVFKKDVKGADATVDMDLLQTPWYQWVAENVGSNNASSDWTLVSALVRAIKKDVKQNGHSRDDVNKITRQAVKQAFAS